MDGECAPALHDGSDFSVRRNSCQRFGELKGRFGRAIQLQRSDETWLPEWSGKLAECSGVPFGRPGVLGKPVFRPTASSQLVESLARWRVQFQSDGTGTQAEGRPG
jgi:hypothetical protein